MGVNLLSFFLRVTDCYFSESKVRLLESSLTFNKDEKNQKAVLKYI